MFNIWKDRLFSRRTQRNASDPHGKQEHLNRIPTHVAVIMDGNGRWAKQRNLPRVAGHRAGMQTIREVARKANELGIKVLTLYAFSTENWKRPAEEVNYLMRLPKEFLDKELQELKENNVRLRMVGSEEGLPEDTLEAIRIAMKETSDNTGLILNFAINYGGRQEICEAVKRISAKVCEGTLSLDELDDRTIEAHLYTKGVEDPDLLIRTSGEIRISNFMLWQLAYTELWFTDVLWPDFTKEDFAKAIRHYQMRKRRFGAV